MIRTATIDDLDDIIHIYNQAIDAKFQTGFTQHLISNEWKGWMLEHIDTPFPLLVHTEGNTLTGWYSASPYRKGRNAFRYTVEISCFIRSDYQHQGIGKMLIAYGLNVCRELNYKSAIAVIIDKNIPSYRLAEKLGFERWGMLPGVGDFNGVECDHYYYGIKL